MSSSVEVAIHQQTWDSEVSPMFVLQEPKLFGPAQAIEIHAVTTAVSPHEWGAVIDSCSLRKGMAGGQDPQVPCLCCRESISSDIERCRFRSWLTAS